MTYLHSVVTVELLLTHIRQREWECVVTISWSKVPIQSMTTTATGDKEAKQPPPKTQSSTGWLYVLHNVPQTPDINYLFNLFCLYMRCIQAVCRIAN